MTDPARIGIVVVHGVGEQQPGAYVEEFARAIAGATDDSLYHGVVNTRPAVVRVDVGEQAELYFHGVDWADIGEPPSFKSRLRFWLWGLSIWGRKGFRKPVLSATARMAHVLEESLTGVRLRLALAGVLFAAGGLVMRAAPQFVFSLPGIGPPLKAAAKVALSATLGGSPMEILVAYAGDVRVYQDDRPRRGPLELRDERPRWSIRRRMIRRLVEAAEADYDRWYVAAHSLGTVVAFNGLMETAEALPNYLDRVACERLRAAKVPDPADDKSETTWIVDGDAQDRKAMQPPGRDYVGPRDRLRRDVLFRGLRGLITFGCPLDKYATLWPMIVPANREAAFAPDFEWVNIYEDNDPVAGKLDQIAKIVEAKPTDYGYRREPTFASAHIRYFAKPERDGSLAKSFLAWVLDPAATFQAPTVKRIAGPDDEQPFQTRLYFQAVGLLLLLCLISGAAIIALAKAGFFDGLAALADKTIDQVYGWLTGTDRALDVLPPGLNDFDPSFGIDGLLPLILAYTGITLIVCILVVAMFGLVAWIVEKDPGERAEE